MSARMSMVQGCTSDAGKGTLVTALCRWARRRGLRVAPFKPQNMALNWAASIERWADALPSHLDARLLKNLLGMSACVL